MEKKRLAHQILRIIITSCALIIALIHIRFPKIQIDYVTLALIIFAALPWLAPIIKRIGVPGLEIELQDIKDQLTAVQREVKQNRRLQEALRDAIFYRLQKRYAEAEAAYKKALSFDPDSEEAKIGLAVAISYMSPKNYNESIKTLTDVLMRYPCSSKAYYNRACIRALLKDDSFKQLWLDDLREAIRLDKAYREYAKKDKDFKKYWRDKAFLKIVNAK